ncbi:MAG: cyanoexosortase A [Cyanobacteria bacterium J06555_13]
MKVPAFNHFFSSKMPGGPFFWLLGIFSGLFFIYANLISRASYDSLIGTGLLYWIAISSMLWSRRETLNLQSGVFGTAIGATLLALILIKSAFMQGYDPFLRVYPFLSVLGLGLLASGALGVRQFWQELGIFAFLIPPPSLLEKVVDTTMATAKFSTALLWYGGFDVVRDGPFILIPNGGVEVYSGCSGVDTIFHMLGLSVIFLAMFPTSRLQKVIIPVIAVVLAFIVNGARVSVMAMLSEPKNKVAFEYWHTGDGSLLFSMFAVVLLCVCCFFILESNRSAPEVLLTEASGAEDFRLEDLIPKELISEDSEE